MKVMVKSALAAVALTVLGAGMAFAAEACACCKGEKMECCDKMKSEKTAPAAEHQH